MDHVGNARSMKFIIHFYIILTAQALNCTVNELNVGRAVLIGYLNLVSKCHFRCSCQIVKYSRIFLCNDNSVPSSFYRVNKVEHVSSGLWNSQLFINILKTFLV